MVLAVAGAIVGAFAVSMLEARLVVSSPGGVPISAGGWFVHWLAAALADLGVIAPLAAAIGMALALTSLFFEPARPVLPSERIERVRRAPMVSRLRAAALIPLATLSACVWMVTTAQLGRALLARGAPSVVGPALAVTTAACLAFTCALAFALLVPLRRALASATSRWASAMDPFVTGALGLGIGALVIAAGIFVGDTGGQGRSPLAIFGVLKRPELDLRPVTDVLVIAACAWTAPIVLGRRTRRATLVIAAATIAFSLGDTVYQANALERDPGLAHDIDAEAALGHLALALDRKVTDRDNDGASPFFGGGDCNDHDPNISPFAVEIPGNGIDEDCSGADLPLLAHPSARAMGTFAAKAVKQDFNLILVTIDTLRATETGFLGYDKPTTPNLDALAAQSVVFERAYAMASYTGKALAPMLIGKYPSETYRDGGHFNKYFSKNTFMAERLRAAGIRTMGAGSHWYLHDSWGLTQGIETFDLSAMPSAGQTDTDTTSTSQQLTDAALRLLDARAALGRFFLWVHYFDPHAQYVPHEGAPDFADPARNPGSRMRALYDGEVWFTDKAIGRLLKYVASQPWGKNTMIVVTSDHGEGMGEHGIAFQHGFEIWEPLVRVPLIVHVPGVAPHRVPVKRSVIDLVPTLLDLMRVPQPPAGELSGQSAVADVFARAGDLYEERDVYIDMPDGPFTHMRRGLIHGPTPGMKLIHFGGRQFRLYDLAADPGETEDLSGDPSKLRPMLDALQAKRATLKEIFVKSDAPVAP